MKITDYIDKQDWDSAIAKCTEKIDEAKKNSSYSSSYVYMNRGYVRCFVPSKDGDYQDAIEDLSIAITLAPDTKAQAECYVKRAYAYWISGRYDNAMADCKKAITLIDPSFEENIIKIFTLAGKAEEMAMTARNIADPTEPAEYKKLETEARKLSTEAQNLVNNVEGFKQAVQDIVSKTEEIVEKAKAVEDAVDILKKASGDKIAETEAVAEAQKAAAEAQKNLEDKICEFNKTIGKVRSCMLRITFAHELQGNIYSAIDEPSEAIEQYKKALSINPGSPSLLDKYREACERLNKRR